MGKALYLNLAMNNIKKNKKLYFPYVLLSTFTIMMCFMVYSIMCNKDVVAMEHSANVIMLLNVAFWILRIFSVIFIFYINSFLMKQKKKEIALYNILGLEKGHIAKMLFCETVILMLICLGAGIGLGIVFNKLMFLLLYRLLNVPKLPAFDISLQAVIYISIFFAIVFLVTLLYNLAKVSLTNPIELLYAGSYGEKEPKSKLLLALIGVVCIGIGYYFALFVKSPMQAMSFFLLAVIAVVIGTYALFTAGSIVFLKMLKKNKKFYYNPRHFSAVSGMLYRMKQNAVGLASICILSTMTLISVSSTFSMYARLEDVVQSVYPKEINVRAMVSTPEKAEEVIRFIDDFNREHQVEVKDYSSVVFSHMTLKKNEDGDFSFIGDQGDYSAFNNGGCFLSIIDLESYNRIQNTNESLEDGEILCYSTNNINSDVLSIHGEASEISYKIKNHLSKSDVNTKFGIRSYEVTAPMLMVVVKDIKDRTNIINCYGDLTEDENLYSVSIMYDTNGSTEEGIALCKEIDQYESDQFDISASDQNDMRFEFRQMYGSFLFMGIIFGALFLLATSVIIYYKQISEGYEDRERFLIMQKVGMSYEEVKKSITSQILIVFFLPLIVAGIHVAVSFRIIKIILAMLSLGNTSLFLICTVCTFLIFSIIYAFVFRGTAKAYYKIVSM